ncbi:DNA-processing protein DprA [Lentzea sp. NPDC004789]
MLDQIEKLPQAERDEAAETAERLWNQGYAALLCDDPQYPDRLRRFAGAPPALFCQGDIDLLSTVSVAVCGSRAAGDNGLRAARACGEEAARFGVTVVSGYAKGVDTESHLAVLRAGGSTVAVLAEGVDHFRLKVPYRELSADVARRLLVVSQFPPRQRWTAGAAMTRNQVITGLSHAVVVIEAGESGGTMKAGEVALRGERPLLVLDGRSGSFPGNERLIAAGGHRVTTRAELADQFRRLSAEPPPPLALWDVR